MYQVLHMDRNDYYGGESTSLNLIQVYVIEVVHNIFSQSELAIHHLILMMVLFIYSSGRGLEEVTSLQLIWVRVGITTWIWSQRFYLPHCVNHCCIPRTFQLVRCFEHFFVSQFMMANGTLVRVLIHTDVTKYLYFKAVDGSFVYNKGKVCQLCSMWQEYFFLASVPKNLILWFLWDSISRNSPY